MKNISIEEARQQIKEGYKKIAVKFEEEAFDARIISSQAEKMSESEVQQYYGALQFANTTRNLFKVLKQGISDSEFEIEIAKKIATYVQAVQQKI